jgi:hypothetical protein
MPGKLASSRKQHDAGASKLDAASPAYEHAEVLGTEDAVRGSGRQTAAESLSKQLEPHTKASEALFGSIRALEAKVVEALSKKETLKARAASAQVSPPRRRPPLSSSELATLLSHGTPGSALSNTCLTHFCDI